MKIKNLVAGIILLVISYSLGIATGHYRFFPFSLIFKMKEELSIEGNSKRNFDVSSLRNLEVPITDRSGIYLTYGQSNSVNHGQIGYEVKSKVYQFLDGNLYLYEDPSLGGTGDGGSVWGMVGDKLIKNNFHDKVIFSNNGWGGRKMEELNKPPYLDYLIQSYKELIDKYGRVDAILFHQGEINHSDKFGNKYYYEDFKVFVQKLKDNGIEIPIYLSRTSICDTRSDETLINIQNQIISNMDIVLEGPNTDLLSEKKYRLPDNCHFSQLGFEKFSDQWFNSITAGNNFESKDVDL